MIVVSLLVQHIEKGPTNEMFNLKCKFVENVVILRITCVGDFSVAMERFKVAMTWTTK